MIDGLTLLLSSCLTSCTESPSKILSPERVELLRLLNALPLQSVPEIEWVESLNGNQQPILVPHDTAGDPIVTHHPLPLPPNILDFSPQSKIQQTPWKSPGMINYLLRSSQLMKPQKSEKLQYVVIDEIITIQRMLRAPTHSLPLPDSARLPTGIYRGL